MVGRTYMYGLNCWGFQYLATILLVRTHKKGNNATNSNIVQFSKHANEKTFTKTDASFFFFVEVRTWSRTITHALEFQNILSPYRSLLGRGPICHAFKKTVLASEKDAQRQLFLPPYRPD